MKWLACIGICLTFIAHADRVGQAGGISENNIQFAYLHLEEYIRFCLALKDCTQNDWQRDVLERELAAQHLEHTHAHQILFSWDHNLFIIDKKERAAFTYNAVGEPIYFNLNQLYFPDHHGGTVGIDMHRAVALLVHEMGHHQGETDHDKLDELGERVGAVLDGRIFPVPLGPQRMDINITYIYFNFESGAPPFTQLILSDGPNYYDLTSDTQSHFQCPLVNGAPAKLVGMALWGFIWLNAGTVDPFAMGRAEPYCQLPNGSVLAAPMFVVRIHTHLNWSKESTWEFDPKGFVVQQTTCEEWKFMCDQARMLRPEPLLKN